MNKNNKQTKFFDTFILPRAIQYTSVNNPNRKCFRCGCDVPDRFMYCVSTDTPNDCLTFVINYIQRKHDKK